MGAEFFRGKFAVAVLVERFEGFGRIREFWGGNGAIVIDIKRRNHRRNGRFVRRWILWVPFPIGRWWHVEFLRGDFAIMVSIKLLQDVRRRLNFAGGQFTVMIRVEQRDQRRDGWRSPVPAGRRGLGCGSDTRGEGEHPLQLECFHNFG